VSAIGQIARYLAQHPDAKDSFEGITDWWLLEEQERPTAMEVKAALDDLVSRGLVIAERGPDGRLYYSGRK